MSMLILLLVTLAGISSLVAWLMTEIRLFSEEGILLGIFGIFCGIYTYWWGWTHIRTKNQRQLMWIWTIATIVGAMGKTLLRLAAHFH